MKAYSSGVQARSNSLNIIWKSRPVCYLRLYWFSIPCRVHVSFFLNKIGFRMRSHTNYINLTHYHLQETTGWSYLLKPIQSKSDMRFPPHISGQINIQWKKKRLQTISWGLNSGEGFRLIICDKKRWKYNQPESLSRLGNLTVYPYKKI